jgi:hypothetical protein
LTQRKIVQPVVVGAADRGRELRVHIVARHERQPNSREEHRDVDALHRHANYLCLGVVAALDREHDLGVGALRDERAADAVVLRDIAVVAQGLAVKEPQRPAAHAGRAAVLPAHRRGDARLEFRVEIFVEQVHRLHDVHVAIDEPIAFLHLRPPEFPGFRHPMRETCPCRRPRASIASEKHPCVNANKQLSVAYD